ncbi:helix-turn-helix domain-containing protein [Leisingera sp. NJS204]
MTQLELARLSNVAQSSISDIETGTVTPRSC